MVIGFDLTWMKVENNFGGVYQYAFRIVSAIVEHTNLNVVVIVAPAGKKIFEGFIGRKNFNEVVLGPIDSFLEIIEAHKIDVLHTPIQRFFNLTFSIPSITTLHDLQHFHYPEFFTPVEIEQRDFFYRLSAKVSERVIVSFQHVKDDIIKFYDIPADKIDVCPLGFDEPKKIDDSAFTDIRNKYHVPESYLFYSANTWRHKNHISLIQALKILHEKYKLNISLISTGQQEPSYFPELQREMDRLKINEYVNFTGYIPEGDVKILLKNASLAVIPTLYEAGSFPLMEAMAYGVPVICSNVTSLPNTIGDSRFVFDPNNPEEIASKIVEMLTDKNLIEANRENSKKRVADDGWDKVANIFANSYQRAVDGFAQKTSMFPSFKESIKSFEQLSGAKTKELKAERDALLNSLSWKVTAPLRLIMGRIIKR